MSGLGLTPEAPKRIVAHVQGFVRDGAVHGTHVAQLEAATVIEVARGIIETAVAHDGTELVRFNRTWPLDGYGQEAMVVEVDAITRTTLDDGKTWKEMWHWFGTLSTPWPVTAPQPPEAPQ